MIVNRTKVHALMDPAFQLVPCLSSKIADQMRRDGLSSAAARQRISRAIKSGALRRLGIVEFPNRESFLFTDEDRKNGRFVERLFWALAETNSAPLHAIHSLNARGGLLPFPHFGIASGSPQDLKGHVSSGRLLQFMTTYGLASVRELSDLGSCIQLSEIVPLDADPSAHHLRARLVAEGIVIGYLVDHFRRLGLIGYESARTRNGDEEPEFGHFLWDVTAPSYMHPFVSRRQGTHPLPGFFVADVVLGAPLSKAQVQYFAKKNQVTRSQPNSRPFLSALVAHSFEKSAWDFLRREGILAVTSKNLLGEDLAAALRSLIETLSNAAAVAASRPEAIWELFWKLSAIEGAAANLRGPLFEMIVAHCVCQREGNSVDIGREVFSEETKDRTNIDVLRVKEKQEVAAYECRGHAGSVKVRRTEVERWLNQTIPCIRDYLRRQVRFQNAKQVFEFWTTGQLNDDAARCLAEAAERTKKYEIRWRDGAAVLEYVRSIKSTYLTDVLNEQYLRTPLAKVVASKERRNDSREDKYSTSEEGTVSG